MVSAAAQLGWGLAAAVGHHSAVALPGADPDALGPVGGAVAAAALELVRGGKSRTAEIISLMKKNDNVKENTRDIHVIICQKYDNKQTKKITLFGSKYGDCPASLAQ